MGDPVHRQIVADALARTDEKTVTVLVGELWLYHTLLQDYGLELIEPDQLIPLMERSAARLG